MYLLLALILSLSCAHKSNERKPSHSKKSEPSPTKWFYLSTCTKDGVCDETSKAQVADYFCRSKGFDQHRTFKMQTTHTSNTRVVKLRTCDLKANPNDMKKSRCEWIDTDLKEEDGQKEAFKKISCFKENKEGADKTFTHFED